MSSRSAGSRPETVRSRRIISSRELHQLVAQGVAEIEIAAGERQGHALLQELRHAEQSLGRHERQDVGLLEIGVRGVDDERDAPVGVVIEAPLQGAVALLGVRQRDTGELLLLGIVVEVDVLAAQHVPIEAAVLDLVLPEVPELGGRRAGKENEQRRSTG
ncbi:MAG: hypothetical protein DMD69_00350 [Gemmatimonadetes bacterium]|nr:MAG: hypothetical protein DMD69_00350 [Gemmatimonadota bacterium]